MRVSPPSDGNGESKSSGWQILHVYGSPNTNASQLSSDGTVMKVSQVHSCLRWLHAVPGSWSCMCMTVAAVFVCAMQLFGFRRCCRRCKGCCCACALERCCGFP